MNKHFLLFLFCISQFISCIVVHATPFEGNKPLAGNKTIPASEIIDKKGRLRAGRAIAGRVDISGYRVTIDPAAGPVFTATSAVCDWESLNTGLNNTVRAIAINGTKVYVGGDFTNAGGIAAADHIACWNGTTWSALGTGLNSDVYAIATGTLNTDELYVGGDFTNAGGTNNADGIARWDGTNWQALGTGLSGGAKRAETIAVTRSGAGTVENVYIGGDFNKAGGVNETQNIARWDGANWHPLGDGLDDVVRAIAVSGSNLYAGGQFEDAGGDNNADYIARWDGTTWSPLGAMPLSEQVRAIAVNGTEVYAGGNFLDAGGVAAADRIARWDGTAWNALGSGLSAFVDAIFVNGSDLYVGGNFTDAGGNVNADYISRWDGSSWQAMGTPLNNPVYAVAASGTDVYVGGVFNNDPAQPNLNYIAQWFEPIIFRFENTTSDENYLTAANWLCNRIPPNPLPYDKAIVIAGDCNAGVNQVINGGASFTVEETYIFSILAGFTFTNYGTMTNDGGTFNINIDGALTNFDLFENNFVLTNAGVFTNQADAVLNNANTAFFSSEDGGQVNNAGSVENDGTFTLETDAEAIDNSGVFNNYNILTLNGLFLNNFGEFTNEGTTDVKYRFTNAGATTNLSGATLNVNNAAVFSNDDEFDNSGVVNIKVGATFDNASTFFHYEDASLINSGTLNNELDGEIELNSGAFGQNSGTLNNLSGASFTMNPGASFANNAGAVFENQAAAAVVQNGALTNAGTVNSAGSWNNGGVTTSNNTFSNSGAFDNTETLTTSGTFTNASTLNNFKTLTNSGTFNNNNGGALNNNTGGVLTTSGTLNNAGSLSNNAVVDNTGTFNNNAGGLLTLTTAAAFNNRAGSTFTGSAGSTLQGTGTFTNLGTYTNGAGAIIPGFSPGILYFTGNFGLGTGHLQIEVQNNSGPGTGHDQLNVTGNINLNNATLTVTEIGSTSNGTFTIVSATGTVTGTFSSPALPVHYSLQYTANSVILVKLNLPVELIDFQVFENSGSALLAWRTASETDNRGFHIERSADGRRWETIGFVAGNGTTQVEQRYGFTDRQPLRGLNYYRLRQEDFSGKIEYSGIQSVKIGNARAGNLHVFPNPIAAGGELKFIFDDNQTAEEALVFDLAGKMIGRQKLTKNEMLLPSGIEPGVYLIKVAAVQGEWPVYFIVK